MLIIQTEKDKTIQWPVKVEVPADGGKLKKFEFTGTFRLLDDDAKDALAAKTKDLPTDPETEAGSNAWKETSVDNILEFMSDWSGVVDAKKTPIEFSRDNLLAAVRSLHGISILRAITTAIGEVATGHIAKN